MDWQTFIISIAGSGVITALVNGGMNYRTQIKTIKESGLYTKRAEVLDELMKKMEGLDTAIRELLSPFQAEGSHDAENLRRTQASNAFNLFFGFYKQNRHYLPKTLSKEIEGLSDGYKDLFIKFSYEAHIPGEKTNTELWHQLHQRIQKEIAESKESIEEEFRKLIGVK